MSVIKWIYERIRSALIIWIGLKLLSWVIPLMSEAAKMIQDGLANTKVSTATITGSGGVGFYQTFVDSAPDVLVFLSIVATGLTIWAHIGSSRRRRVVQKEEAENRALEKKLLEEQLREVSVRAEAQDMLVERLAKKHPEAAQEMADETLDNIVSWKPKERKA